MDENVEGGGDLGVQRASGQSTQGTQGLQPRRNISRGVGVNGAAAALMAGVQRCEEVCQLSSADLADHQAIGPHSQGVPDQVGQGDRPDPLRVGWPSLQPNDVRMLRAQFAGVLDQNDPSVGVHQTEQGGQQGGLAGAGSARDQEGAPRRHQLSQNRARLRGHGGGGDPVAEAQRARGRNPQREAGAAVADQREHRMHPGSVRQSGVGEGAAVIEPPTDRRGQPDGQPPHLAVVSKRRLDPFQPATPIDEHQARSVHHHIGHPGQGQQLF